MDKIFKHRDSKGFYEIDQTNKYEFKKLKNHDNKVREFFVYIVRKSVFPYN